jgi:hypothetical protein
VLHEDKHRYRGNGAGMMATLRIAAINLLHRSGFDSIREGLQSVMHDIKAAGNGQAADGTKIELKL